MNIEQFLGETSKRALPLETLSAVASDSAAFGPDVISAFKAQVEHRTRSAKSVIEEAERAGRENLLASESRSYNSAVREKDEALRLLQAIENRTELRAHVPATQQMIVKPSKSETTIFGSAEEFRSLVGNTGSGSYVSSDEQATSFFDKLSSVSVALASGVTVIPTTRDALRVPTITADMSVAWTSEGSQISPSDPTFSETVATPRKIAAYTIVSNELLDDSSPKILAMLEMQLARAIALKFDLGFFEGSGTPPEIRGLKNVPSINSAGSPGGTGTAAGGFTNLDFFASAVGQLYSDNAQPTAAVCHPRTWTQLLKLKEQTSSNNKPLLTDGVTAAERRIYGVPVHLSSQLSTTETVSSSTDCSSIYVYQASEIVVVRRADIRIEVDRSFKFDYDSTCIRAVMRIDVVAPNAKAINRISGIRA